MMDVVGKKKTLKRKCISIKEKIIILDRLNSGEKVTDISKQLRLNESTIRTIRKNENKIRRGASVKSLPVLRKTARIRDPLISRMESCLMIWMDDCNQKNIPLNNHLIRQKACKIYCHLKQHSSSDEVQKYDFKGSQGWFERFKRRFSLHNIKIQRERADLKSAKEFREEFPKILEDGGYTADQVFNADETGLFWKRMPQRTFLSKADGSAAEERVTLLLCSNASGNYVMKPLLITKSLSPHVIKGYDKSTFPVYWQENKKAFVTATIFREWFFDCFVPDVEYYLKGKKLSFKALLIIDNAPGHPIDLSHQNVKVLFLPPNTNLMVHPLNQGIIKTFKSYYMRRTLEHILEKIDRNHVAQIWKDFSILHCINIIGLSLEELNPSTMNASWKNIWPEIVNTENISLMSIDTESIITVAQVLGGEGFDDMNEDDVLEFLNSNENLNESELMQLTAEPVLNISSHQESSSPEDTKININYEYLSRGLELAKQVEEYFTTIDPSMERSTRFKRNLKDCLAPYFKLQRELQSYNGTAINKILQENIFIGELDINIKSETESVSEN